MTYPSDPIKAILLYALHRNGEPAPSATLHDLAVKLMQAEGWPSRMWRMSGQGAFTTLRAMVAEGVIVDAPETRVNGRSTPQFGLLTYNARIVPPPAPDPEGENHPLHGKTRRQQYVLFDVQDTMLQTLVRQYSETRVLMERHASELARLVDRQRCQLAAAGLETP